MERALFMKKTCNKQTHVDRFVPPRQTVNDKCRRRSHPDCQSDNADTTLTKYWHQKSYRDLLKKSFGVDQETDKYVVQPWPCIPRKKSYISSADSILDLPAYSHAHYPELLDWSNDDVLVASLGKNYHKWSWGSQNLTGQGKAINVIRSCKFDPRADLLILGTDNKIVEFHDNERSKIISRGKCYCFKPGETVCSITAIDWSPTGNSFATGCTMGLVTAYTRSSEPIGWAQYHYDPVYSVRISPDARFAATTSVSSTIVMLFSWPFLQVLNSFDFTDTVNFDFNSVIAWHPWRSALLAIGMMTRQLEPRVVMCEAPTAKLREYNINIGKQYLDAMLFSSRTGELVMSLFNRERGLLHQKMSSQLLVLSNPESVVDQWYEDGKTALDRVRTMVFSPDGTKLATATSEEDLIIWNFLPESEGKKKENLEQFSAVPVLLDKVTQGYVLR